MSIQNYLEKIKTSIFGKDVRQSIHDAIKQCYDDATINHDNANMEVKLARGTHDTLNSRITENEKKQEKISSQLDNKTQQLENSKATKTEVDIKRGYDQYVEAYKSYNAIEKLEVNGVKFNL